MITLNDRAIIALAAIGLVSLWYIKRQAVELAKEASTKLNPVSDENIAYTGLSSLIDEVAADGDSLPLGVRIYDWVNEE